MATQSELPATSQTSVIELEEWEPELPEIDSDDDFPLDNDYRVIFEMECKCQTFCNLFFCRGPQLKGKGKSRFEGLSLTTLLTGLVNNMHRYGGELVERLAFRLNSRIREWTQQRAVCNRRNKLNIINYQFIVEKIEIDIDHYITRFAREHLLRQDIIPSLKGGYSKRHWNEMHIDVWERTNCPVFLEREEDIFHAFSLCDEVWRRLPTALPMFKGLESSLCEPVKDVNWKKAAIEHIRRDAIIFIYYPNLIIESLAAGDCFYNMEELRPVAENVYKNRYLWHVKIGNLRSLLIRYDEKNKNKGKN